MRLAYSAAMFASLIRSLNMHVSGATAMYEYTRQQLVAGHHTHDPADDSAGVTDVRH